MRQKSLEKAEETNRTLALYDRSEKKPSGFYFKWQSLQLFFHVSWYQSCFMPSDTKDNQRNGNS